MAGLRQEIDDFVEERTEGDLMLHTILMSEEGLNVSGLELTPMQVGVAALRAARLVYEIDLRIADHVDALPNTKGLIHVLKRRAVRKHPESD